MPRFKFNVNSSMLKTGLDKLEPKTLAKLQMYADSVAIKLQNYARANRPWTDRTGAARQRLTGKAEKVPTGYLVELSHGVDYGIWLEEAHEKNYAIIQPTILALSKEIMEGLKNLF